MANKKGKKFTFRTWLTIITWVLLVIVVFAGRHEIEAAWNLLGEVNLWILSLLIPVQLLSYYAVGGIIFSYLRKKGQLKDISHWYMTRISLELNFVNHILPSGGAAGFSYLAWVLKRHGISVARSTMAQIIRFSLTFVSFALLLVAAVTMLSWNHTVNRATVFSAGAIAAAVILAIWGLIWVMNRRARLDAFSSWVERATNRVVKFFTRGKRRRVLRTKALIEFFDDLHDDYLAIKRERRILVWPFVWAILANILDVVLIWVAFLALGVQADFALLFIAYGLSAILGAISVTPAGAGVYEATMVTFLVSAGMPLDTAIAGTVLARVILVLGTILFGYVFYQLTIMQFGEKPEITNDGPLPKV